MKPPPPKPKPPERCEGCGKDVPGNLIKNTQVQGHTGVDAFKMLCPACRRRWEETGDDPSEGRST